MSPRELSGTTEVAARDKLRNGRATNATDFGDRTVVVPADMPADTFGGVMSMTALSLVAMLVIWGGAGIAVSILAKR